MNRIARSLACLGVAVIAPVWAVSLPKPVQQQPRPHERVTPASFHIAENLTAGSALLVPLMEAEHQAGGAVGEPIDDLAFVKQATEGGRKEVGSAREALPQLKQPELKRVAEMLVSDHSGANARLAKIAAAKGWPVPGTGPLAAPPKAAGTASGDFDARWTAEMIAGHERSAALYRAQARGGVDEDLRNYARETLPTIERHLAELRKLQQ